MPDAVRAAHRAGFAAVELHWPYDVPADDLNAALVETDLPVLGLNTIRGDVAAGAFGLAAMPGQEAEARAAIDQAIGYAAEIGAGRVHVMAGKASGPKAEAAYLENLTYACTHAAKHGQTILIEPLNAHDAPGYFLRDTAQGCAVIDQVGADNLALMFDCYHVARTEGDILGRLRDVLPYVGHIQFAGVPDRGRPDEGVVDYSVIFDGIKALGWTLPLGAEYLPRGDTDATLGWMG